VFAAAAAAPNYLRVHLGPERTAIALGARTKRPGVAMVGNDVELYVCDERGEEMQAYERLIGDALNGDATLFARQDAVEAAWRIVDPVVDRDMPVHRYAGGTWGPVEADALIANGEGWHNPRLAARAKGQLS
jgi:glucose-6-phosphate 1-dehydrogenase